MFMEWEAGRVCNLLYRLNTTSVKTLSAVSKLWMAKIILKKYNKIGKLALEDIKAFITVFKIVCYCHKDKKLKENLGKDLFIWTYLI